jgi:hypothetical protein
LDVATKQDLTALRKYVENLHQDRGIKELMNAQIERLGLQMTIRLGTMVATVVGIILAASKFVIKI